MRAFCISHSGEQKFVWVFFISRNPVSPGGKGSSSKANPLCTADRWFRGGPREGRGCRHPSSPPAVSVGSPARRPCARRGAARGAHCPSPSPRSARCPGRFRTLRYLCSPVGRPCEGRARRGALPPRCSRALAVC